MEKYYKPTKVGKNFIIKPTWEEYNLSENEVMIELDPGMAFGTGTHETTALCLEALEKIDLKIKQFLISVQVVEFYLLVH